MKRLIIGLVLASALAGCGDKTETASEEPAPTFTGAAAEIDAYLSSDKAMDEMLAQVCGDMSKCKGLPNIFQILKRSDAEGYAAFVERAAATPGVGAADIGFEYATAATNRAVIDLEDADVEAVTKDTIKSFDEIKAVYPQLCVDTLMGRGSAPPADVAKQLFNADRFRLNMKMIEKAAANRKRMASGDLKIEIHDAATATKQVEGFFAQLSPAEQATMQRLAGGTGSTDEFPIACDTMGAMMQHLLDQPGGAATIRGLGKMGDPPT